MLKEVIILYNSTNVAEMIKKTAKLKNIQLKDMLIELQLNKNTLSNMYKGSMLKGDSLARIADYLNCSVDYLLGRTDEHSKITGSTIAAERIKDTNIQSDVIEDTSIIGINIENTNIGNAHKRINPEQATSENEAELLEIYRSLNLRDKTTLMNFIFKIKEEATKV